jgi:hypothetical protein
MAQPLAPKDGTAAAPDVEVAAPSTDLPPEIAEIEPTPQKQATPAARASSEAFGQLGLARLLDLRESEADVVVGAETVVARLSPVLDAAVLVTALERGEPVLVQRAPSGEVMVMGALRTQATPGVDAMEEVAIEADRIHLRGRKEVALSTSGVAQMALRAAGEIETYASRIVSRAEELHKIVGRMLRLN